MIIVVGIAMFFNFAVIYLKFNNSRALEGTIDLGAFALIMYLSAMAGQGGMYAGTIASAIFSIFLFFSPPKILNDIDSDTTETRTTH